MKEQFVGCWYFYIHNKLKERARNNIISYKDARSFLFEWRIPKFMRNVILRELEILGLIKKEERGMIILKESKITFDNPSMIYDLVGLLPE